jgi:CRISPR-associated protein Cas7/Cst2/DevR subtype I-B
MDTQSTLRPFVLGVLLMDEWAASPNMGETIGEGASKRAQMKWIKTSEGNKTILSGQCVGSWHRQVLYDRYGWKISELQETISTRDSRSFYTQCQPIEYAEDDGRGYLAAVSMSEKFDGKDKKVELTTKRTSPFMLSQFQSVAPNVRMNDFGILARNLDDLPEDVKGALIFRAEIAAAAYAGLFALNLSELGSFMVGVGRDLLPFSILEEWVTSDKSSFRSALAKSEAERDDKKNPVDLFKALKRCVNADRGTQLVLPPSERKARAHDLIAALADLEGGAHMTRRLYNVAPSTALVAFMNGGNCLPPHIIRAVVRDEDDYGNKTYKFVVDIDRLWRVLQDNQDRFLCYEIEQDGEKKPGHNLFFGTLGAPSIENADEVRALLEGKDSDRKLPETVKPMICNGPREAIRTAAAALPQEWFAVPPGATIIDDRIQYGEALLKQD